MKYSKDKSGTRSSAFLLALTLVFMPFYSAWAVDVTDQEITNAVDASLWADDAVSANLIDVTTTDGVVELAGEVRHILAKDRAQEIASATVGVRAVVNRIEVDPVIPREDEELEEAVQNAMRADPAVYAWYIDASAEDGEVTLTGTVDSYAKRALAETVAKGVRGVTAVENNIDIDYETERFDSEIETEIAARLENDVRINDALIEVSVEDGDVALSGTVGSVTERNRAYSLSWVAGVNSVNRDDLNVRYWAHDEMRRTAEYVVREDGTIKESVEDALLHDPRVYSFEVGVSVQNRAVTLTGQVDNFAAKTAAEQTARNVTGVRTVRNHINVRPEIPADDALEDRITTALENDPLVNRYAITVSAEDGWVYLRGEVNTSAQKARAESVAERQFGVVGVVNTIDYDHEWIWKADEDIRQDVRNQLQWNPFVDEGDINVSVENGIVTLTGTVDTMTEKSEAKKNALQGGAKSVENKLVVGDPYYYGPPGPAYYGYPYAHDPYYHHGYHGLTY